MNFQELVSTVSAQTGIPAGQVNKVGKAILKEFAELIEKQDVFLSPILTFRTSIRASLEADGEKPFRPEQKFARMIVRPDKAI